MRFRVIAIAALIILALSVSVFAAPGAPGRPGKPEGGPGIMKQLGLTDQQAGQIRDIVKKFNSDVRDVMKSSATKDEKATKIKDLKAKAADAIMAVLTPDQQAKAKKTGLVDRLLSRDLRGEMRLEWAIRQLDLTDAQKTQIKAIFDGARTQAEAIRADTTLTPEQRQAKVKALREDTRTKVMAVLTPEQQQKLKDILGKRPKASE